MSKAKIKFRRPLSVLLTSVCCAAVALPLLAADGAGPVPTNAAQASGVQGARPSSALVNLITRLGESGALKPEEATELVKLAEADAADARVQTALTALATAQAEAAQIRSEAAALQAAAARNALAKTVSNTTSAATPAGTAKTAAAVVDAAVSPVTKQSLPEDDTVRVTYVPEVVKAQLREEIKNEVMEQARTEHWAAPRSFPDWVSRFTLYGDFRMRYDGMYYHKVNTDFLDNTNFWNYNAINTGSPYDSQQLLSQTNPPLLNIEKSRSRLRVRARLGAAVDLAEGFTTGLRIATGDNNSPVSQNQTLGAASSGQGGNFNKFSLWLDRAYLKYQSDPEPSRAITMTVGRFENPFVSTSIIWADDLGFDGAALTLPAQIHWDGRVVDSVKPSFVVGAFPVFNTDLNYSSTWPDKYSSNDKWLYAGQFVLDLKLNRNIKVKLGSAYYFFTKTVGKKSTRYQPLYATDAGDTDARRPAFAQKGNTYMELRDIELVYGTDGKLLNTYWQYYGLATPFRISTYDFRVDLNHFEPFQISLMGQYIKNLGFDAAKIRARAPVNNLGSSLEEYVGGDSAYICGLKIGDAIIQKRWDWSLNLNYRHVESDAVIDGFCDSDFGGGGTNVKGFTVGGLVGLSKRVQLGAKWMNSSEVSGPPLKNTILQMDINAKF